MFHPKLCEASSVVEQRTGHKLHLLYNTTWHLHSQLTLDWGETFGDQKRYRLVCWDCMKKKYWYSEAGSEARSCISMTLPWSASTCPIISTPVPRYSMHSIVFNGNGLNLLCRLAWQKKKKKKKKKLWTWNLCTGSSPLNSIQAKKVACKSCVQPFVRHWRPSSNERRLLQRAKEKLKSRFHFSFVSLEENKWLTIIDKSLSWLVAWCQISSPIVSLISQT